MKLIISALRLAFFEWVLCSFGAFILPLASSAQALQFETFAVENGLSSNKVYSLLQDRRGFIWAGTRDGLNRFDGYRFIVYKSEQGNPNSLSNSQINALHEDREGQIWVGTHNGISVFDPRTERFKRHKHDPGNPTSITSNLIYCFWEDGNGDIWVGTDTKLEKYERKTGHFIHFDPPPAREDAPDEVRIHRITEYKGDLFLAMWGAGVWRFNKKTGAMARIFTDQASLNGAAWVSNIWADPKGTIWATVSGHGCAYDPAQNLFRLRLDRKPDYEKDKIDVLFRSGDGKMYIGTCGAGLKIWDEQSGETKTYLLSDVPLNKSSNWIDVILADRSGQIWMGTSNQGVVKFNPRPKQFETFKEWENGRELGPIRDVTGLREMANGEIWAASATYGLRVWDPETCAFSHIREKPKVPASFFFPDAYHVFQDKKGRIWVGTWGDGYTVWDEKTGESQHFVYRGPDQKLALQNSIAYIFEASDGSIWVGTYRGVFKIRVDESEPVFSKKFKFENVEAIGCQEEYVGFFVEDHLGNIWMGTLTKGLLRFNPNTQEIRAFKHDPDDARTLSGSRISCIFEDRKKRLWVGTTNGLNRFLPESGQFQHFQKRDGLPADAVRSIVEDAKGFLWLTTGRGLSKFDPESGTFFNFFKQDGLPCEDFSSKSLGICRASQKIYAGGADGFVLFHPDSIHSNGFVPPVVVARLKKYVVSEGQTRAVEVAGISASDRIELPFSENTLTFEFAALDFQQPSKNQFAYRLLGMGEAWVPLGTAHEVTFSSLAPGNYTLQVRASNSDGLWNEVGTSLEIKIAPPWWATWWAYAGYVLVVGGVLFAFFKLRQTQHKAKNETQRLQVLNTLKSQFLNTVSHELRTPMTSILGFSKIIQKRLEERVYPNINQSDPKTERAVEQIRENLKIVISESERLTVLINEVLDLAKIESGKMVWHSERIQLRALIEQATATTTALFEAKNLRLETQIEPNLPELTGDPHRLLQVLVNLLSNAVKFTEHGTVTVSAKLTEDNNILIGVADTGIGIPAAFLGTVFEHFKQLASDTLPDKPRGTGLGLAICKEIVERHKGRIWVESEVDKGSVFWFTLPV